MSTRNRVQDQVQAPLGRCHRLRIARNDEVIGAQLAGGRLFLPVGRNGRHRVAHGLGQLQAHLAESSETEDADIQAALGCSEPLERSKHGDAGAEDRSGKLERVRLVDLGQVSAVGRNFGAEASVGVAAVVGVDSTVLDGGAGRAGVALLADVLLVVGARVAGQAGVDVVADADVVADLKVRKFKHYIANSQLASDAQLMLG